MTIVPDDKDWTWVLERPCPECGFDAAAHSPDRLGAELRAMAGRWRALLTDRRAAERPAPDQWSALEYGCHVRDVLDLAVTRTTLMLTEDDPLFANWDQDATAVEDDYASQSPSTVAYQLGLAAGKLADLYDRTSGSRWQRTGRRGDGASFTVASFGVYLLHDPLHHEWDVARGYELLDG